MRIRHISARIGLTGEVAEPGLKHRFRKPAGSKGPREFESLPLRIGMNIAIRKGIESDFPALFALIQELADFEKSRDALKNSIEQMREEKDLINFFVAEDAGQVVGIIVYFFAYYTWAGKSLYVDDLYVKPEYRGKKVGTQLLKKVFEIAKQEKCKRVRWQVMDWNERAIEFYKKCGARMGDKWFNCDFDENAIDYFLSSHQL